VAFTRNDDHPYNACPDDDCPRFPCRVYKEGMTNGYAYAGICAPSGYPDGYAAGYGAGFAAGYSAGYSAGAADGGASAAA
jgi:hypothetical protein